jgi:hypothetical protein
MKSLAWPFRKTTIGYRCPVNIEKSNDNINPHLLTYTIKTVAEGLYLDLITA